MTLKPNRLKNRLVRLALHWFAPFACILIFADVPAAAQPSAKDTWWRASSGPITLYSDAKEGKVEEILVAMKQFQAVLSAIGSPPPENEPPTVIFAFGRDRSIDDYFAAPNRRDIVQMVESSIRSDGTYVRLNATGGTSEVTPWAFRAYLGPSLYRRFPDLPYWARSGLGSFYSNVQITRKGSVSLGRPNARYVERLRNYSWIPMTQVFQVEQGSSVLSRGDSLVQFQAQAWVFTHFAMTGGGGDRTKSAAIYSALSQGLSPEEAVRQSLGLSVSELEAALQNYMRSRTLPVLTLQVPDLPGADFPVERVSNEEISLLLGQQLVRSMNPPPVELSERHLQPITSDPEWGGDALATLAELRLESGLPEEAGELYLQAIERQPKQATSFLNYADFLEDHSPADAEKRRQLLQRAVALDPLLGDAFAALALTYDDEDSDKMLEYMARAALLLPDRPDIAYNLAIAHLRLEDPVAARAVVDRHLGGPDNRARAEEARNAISRFELVSSSNRAAREGNSEAAADAIRDALGKTSDPIEKVEMRARLERVEAHAKYQRHVEAYNAAIAQMNAGQRKEGERALLELIDQVEDQQLLSAIKQILLDEKE